MWFVMSRLVVGPIIRILGRPRVSGRSHIPKTGGVILAGNHLAVVDSFLVPVVVPRQMFYLGKQEYVSGTGPRGRATAWLFRSLGMVPVERAAKSAAADAVRLVCEVVNGGAVFGIYPEGTRSPDGRLYKGHTGVAKIALATGAPVVPVAVVGTDKFNPPGTTMWRPHHLQVKFGTPLDFSRYDGMAGDRWAERAIVDQIMHAIVDLSGQEYVDVYAASVKNRRPSPT